VAALGPPSPPLAAGSTAEPAACRSVRWIHHQTHAAAPPRPPLVAPLGRQARAAAAARVEERRGGAARMEERDGARVERVGEGGDEWNRSE